MANDLTGDYDVVAQFTVAAVNRVLAGMHRGNRFPHSLSVRVDDTPQSMRSARSVVDRFGNAISDPVLLGQTGRSRGMIGLPPIADFTGRNVDPVVNANITHDARLDVFSHSHLQGIAQLQLGAPTIQLPADGSATATVRTPVRVRYFPDPRTMPLPEFMRGEILTTLGAQSAASAAGTFIKVGLLGPAGNIHFNQIWPPQRLDPGQLAAVNQALRNSLTSSFQPSNAPLPAGVAVTDFKSLPGTQMVAALMSREEGASPSPDSAETVFLGGGDHFALAVNGDSITGPFAHEVNAAINPRQFGWDTRFNWISGTWFLFTRVFVLNATVELQDATNSPFAMPRILLTIPVQVRFGWKDKPRFVPDPQNFDFTVSQAFTLSVSFGNIGLHKLGDVETNIPSNVSGDIANLIRTEAKKLFDNAWNSRHIQVEEQINAALSAAELQEFLRELMNPSIKQERDTPEQKRLVDVEPQLTYTSVEIRSAGIVLHGSLALPDWPAAHVEFDLNPWTADSPNPEYNALNSWIPGGTIEDYVWSYRGNARPPDPNTFVSTNASAIGWAPNSVCLVVRGLRLSSSGPVVLERVSRSLCKGLTIPKAALKGFGFGALPDIALRQPSLGVPNLEEVVAHTSPWAGPAENTANFLIHFPDRESALHLDLLTRALEQSGRSDTVTAIVCVLASDQLSRVQPIDGLILADDAEGWERLFDISRRPASVLLSPSGEVAWRRQGRLTGADLAAALEKHLASGGFFIPQFLESPLRIGQRAPNFLFESAPGLQLTLRKLTGRSVVLLFWRSASKPSLEMLRTLHKVACQPGAERPVILAIGDGEDGDYGRKLAESDGLSAVIVPDPERSISQAYGVGVWPTAIFLDADSFIEDIRYGLIPEEELRPRVETKLPELDLPGKEY